VTLIRTRVTFVLLAALTACYSPDASLEWADNAVYPILEQTAEKVTGAKREFVVERAPMTLRQRLVLSRETVLLTLAEALDVAAENSREFQRQKETLFLAALNLTRAQNDFRWRFGGGGGAGVNGEADETANAALSDDLSAAASSVVGTRVVANFVQTFLRSVINGGGFDGSSIFNLTLTQPLLRGAGRRIAREPLTQAERNVIYAMRDFERFRAQFAVDVVSDYWTIARQIQDLANVEANYQSLRQSREQIEELYKAGRRTIVDLGRAQQSEYNADAQRVNARNRLQTTLDRFKLTLGLPVTARVTLDANELQRLADLGVDPVELTEDSAVELALQRRFDYRNTIDEVEDAGRRVFIAENALNLQLDFTAAISVPAESGRGPELDWSRINWNAGVDVDLLLDRIPLRNAYRSTLITFDLAIRSREQAEDQLSANVRASLRNIVAAVESYKIQSVAVALAEQRVEATTDLYAAGRVQALDKLDAQGDLLQAQLQRNAAIVDFAIARLQLMNDLEAIRLEPQGLRFDPTLPMPTVAAE
jgi:outer membrane protein TolC